jgi:RNA polymerase sigma-70 factor (ECF subfamily)
LQEKDIQTGFTEKINECKGIIYKICHLYASAPADQEDLFQEIVIQLWKGWPRFRGDSKFSTWLYRVALNTAISDVRKQKRTIELSFPEFIPAESPDPGNDNEKEEKLKQMYKAIAQLNEVDRAVVLLYLDDNSYEEIEEILGINQISLRVKMNRAKEKLRQLTKNEMYGT